MNKKKLLFLIFFLLLIPLTSRAGILENIDCVASGNCQLEDIALGFVEIINWMLGTIGAVALLYFIWGGIQWLTSMGSPNRVKRGKEIMLGTIFSLLITFTSYLMLNFFVNDLLIGDEGDQQFKVASECQDKSRGTFCNKSIGNYYQCDGAGNCVTACTVLRLNSGEDWRCIAIPNLEAFQGRYVTGHCPGESSHIYCAVSP